MSYDYPPYDSSHSHDAYYANLAYEAQSLDGYGSYYGDDWNGMMMSTSKPTGGCDDSWYFESPPTYSSNAATRRTPLRLDSRKFVLTERPSSVIEKNISPDSSSSKSSKSGSSGYSRRTLTKVFCALPENNGKANIEVEEECSSAAGGNEHSVATKEESSLGQPITTMMLRNIPCRKTLEQVMTIINLQGFEGKYDLLYMPRDFLFCKSNLGYAFINFTQAAEAEKFSIALNGYQFKNGQSTKACKVSPARIQGLHQNLAQINPGNFTTQCYVADAGKTCSSCGEALRGVSYTCDCSDRRVWL